MTDIASQFGAPPIGDTMRRMGEGSPFAEANATLNLTPEEQALYIRHLQNLWGAGGTDNPATAQEPYGSRSSLYAKPGVPVGNGRFAVVPTLINGQRIMDMPSALLAAAAEGGPKGLGAYPTYGSAKEAVNRYGDLHSFLAQDTRAYLNAKPRTDVLEPFDYPGKQWDE